MATRNLAVVALTAGLALSTMVSTLIAADPPDTVLGLTVTNFTKTVTWPRAPIPALEQNRLLASTNLTNFAEVPGATLTATPSQYVWRASNNYRQQFYNLQLLQMSSNDLLRANVLNRLAYGPTP